MTDISPEASSPATPPAPPTFRIRGSDLQFVEIVLEPKQSLIAEKKSMMYVENKVAIETVLGDGAQARFGVIGRFWNALKRSFTGESLFSNVYRNESSSAKRVAIAAPGPGAIIAIDLKNEGGGVVCQKGAFLCGDLGTRVALAFQKRLRTGFLGGEGFVMQKITGEGRAFIHACGALKIIELQPGQDLRVDTGCLVALAPTVNYDIVYAGSLKTSIFGGEGMFYAKVQGPGRVWLQSLPMHRLSATLFASAFAGKSRGPWGKIYLVIVVVFVLISLFAGGPDPS